jgi:uncharacterized protein YcbK (DUF882 family)
MGIGNLNVGQVLPLHTKLKKAVVTAALAGTLGLALFMGSTGMALSGGETRTISLVHQHTKEKLTITYKQNGKYVPSAMKKINYLLRDWRRKETITIDPRTIDLIWELHADLGSKKPIHIVCGYRSPRTNAFLKRIGRNVARKSQHTKGKAIDFFFPDVNTLKIRNSALARRVGGVGYYRSSGGPSGFLHADSGNVRHWGPRISRGQLASIIKEGRKTIGRRGGRKGVFDNAPETQVAENEPTEKKSGGLLGWIRGDKKKPKDEIIEPVVAAVEEPPEGGLYEGDDDELAALSEDAAAATAAEVKAKNARKPTPVAPVAEAPVVETPVVEEPLFVEATPEPVAVMPKVAAVPKLPVMAKKDMGALAALAGTAAVEEEAARKISPVAASMTSFIPLPRLKPKAVLKMAAAQADDDVIIQPVSAEPEQTWKKKSNRPSPVVDAIGTVEAAETLTEIEEAPVTDTNGKSSLDADIRSASTEDMVVIEPVLATSAEPSWLSSLYASAEAGLRRDGVKPAPAAITSMPVAAVLGPDGSGDIEISAPVAAEGKGDSLLVNREGKGSLPNAKLRLSSRQ